MENKNILEENLKLLAQSMKFQCEEKWAESWEVLQKSWGIMQNLIRVVDSQPQIQQILTREREILPNVIIQNNEGLLVDYESLKEPEIHRDKRKVSKKHLWSEKENENLKEAINKFGTKDLRTISKYIGTRSITQIRSKLQKLLKKKNYAMNSSTTII